MLAENLKNAEVIKDIAFRLQLSILAVTSKSPVGIATDEERTHIKIVWSKGYSKKKWYNQTGVRIVIEAFIQKFQVNIHEIAEDKLSGEIVWLEGR